MHHAAGHIQRSGDFILTMGAGQEPGLEGRWGQIDAAIEHAMEKFTETIGITGRNLGKTRNRVILCEENTKHATDTVGGQGYARFLTQGLQTLG